MDFQTYIAFALFLNILPAEFPKWSLVQFHIWNCPLSYLWMDIKIKIQKWSANCIESGQTAQMRQLVYYW
jgi:hypothetical protein